MHEKNLIRYLSNTQISDKIFNSYLYNTADHIEFSKIPIIGEDVLAETLKKQAPEKNDGPKKKEEQKHTEPEPEPEPTNDSTYAQYIYLIKINKNQIVEILFVLSTLLSGKRKAELQRRFLNFAFLGRLSALYKQIKWQPFTLPVFLGKHYE